MLGGRKAKSKIKCWPKGLSRRQYTSKDANWLGAMSSPMNVYNIDGFPSIANALLWGTTLTPLNQSTATVGYIPQVVTGGGLTLTAPSALGITWANTLAAGNTSGANNPIITSGQSILYASSAVSIGKSSTAPTGMQANDIVIGSAVLTGAGTTRVHLGTGTCGSVGAANPCFSVNATIAGTSGGNVAILATNVAAQGDIAIGQASSTAGGSAANRIAIGTSAVAGSAAVSNAIAIGPSASATGASGSIAIGNTATTNSGGVALGNASTASGGSGIAIGPSAATVAADDIAIGRSAVTVGTTGGAQRRVAIGGIATAGAASAVENVAVGYNARATGLSSQAFGGNANSTSDTTLAVGYSTTASGSGATALGSSATASAASTTAVGGSSVASHSGATALGYFASTTATNQVMIGNNGTAGCTQVKFDVGIGGEAVSAGFFKSIACVRAEMNATGAGQTLAVGAGETTVQFPAVSYSEDHEAPNIQSVANQLQQRQNYSMTGMAQLEITWAAGVAAAAQVTVRVKRDISAAVVAVSKQTYDVPAGSAGMSITIPYTSYVPSGANGFMFVTIDNPAALAQIMTIGAASHFAGVYVN
jgi:hypothetical protein